MGPGLRGQGEVSPLNCVPLLYAEASGFVSRSEKSPTAVNGAKAAGGRLEQTRRPRDDSDKAWTRRGGTVTVTAKTLSSQTC